MEQEPINFEPTSSWCYRFARYRALPEILAMPEVASGQPVRLLDYSVRMLDKYLTKEQQAQRFPKAEAVGEDLSVARGVKFWIPYIAWSTKQLKRVGGGMFRLPTDEDVDVKDIEAEAIDAGVADGVEEDADFDGWIYAFSFPTIRQPDKPFPIKVGRTVGDVESRVTMQCRSSAAFENPIILGRWKVTRVGPMELAIHNVLKARGKWRENVPGTEWFDTRYPR